MDGPKAAEAREPVAAGADFLAGGGEMGKLIRSIDWSRTPLGPIEAWPQSLRTTVSLCIASNFPISMAWGPKHIQIYNDGYWPICGGKHPHSMGQDFRQCWASAWPVIGEAFDRALAGESQYLENQRMFLDRNGYLEETFFTFSFSPIRDETGGVGGLFHPVTETTSKMLSERRTRALRDLAARAGKAKSVEEVFVLAAETLGDYDLDLPFALFYLIDPAEESAVLVSSASMRPGTAASRERIDLGAPARSSWPLAEIVQSRRTVQVDALESRFGRFSCGPYPETPKTALALPIIPPGAEHPAGVLVAGASSRLPFDDAYRGFLDLLTAAVTTAVANARAYEEERRRAEALAEIDRAKTLFFSNVSHEFRTPLTLILGPLADILADPDLTSEVREQIDLVHRNGLRLLKLVNTLLDFSRIEAGRAQASYVATDLAAVTADLASNFRSACERAGLHLVVDCPPLAEPVYVDRDMWEKIVLNLLSNAFKYTFEGEIVVAVRPAGEKVELVVRDTGGGIPEAELPRIFDRFQRVEGARGRTHEGSGIGLALVQELVKLHGGAIRVQSAASQGATFVVSIPLGFAHLPAERIEAARTLPSTAVAASAFVEEALRWLPDRQPGPLGEAPPAEVGGAPAALSAPGAADLERGSARILWADDNADMRDYVRRLLSGRYEVEAVADGEAALAAARANPPDLVLADVMMPGLDGFALLRALRADPRLRTVPVVLLSARAGEESRVEGLEAGAADYLVKPFSARELLARTEAQLAMTGLRRELARGEEFARRVLQSSQDCIKVLDLEARLLSINECGLQALEIADLTVVRGTSYLELWRGEDRAMARDAVDRALAGGAGRFTGFYRAPSGKASWWDEIVSPISNADGKPERLLVVSRDISERRAAERKRKLLVDELNHRVKNTLATVQSIASQTLKGDASLAAEKSAFEGRLIAMSKLHDLLTDDHWETAGLRDIMLKALAPHGAGDSGRFAVEGPAVRLKPKAALALGMAVHELATNAAKYGALSGRAGKVRVVWDVDRSSEPQLRLRWTESDGPPVAPPARKGFGSLMIQRGLAHDLGGEVELRYDPGGVTCAIDMPLAANMPVPASDGRAA